ncbi:MAG: hypothetical protein OXP69_23965, partial [Spirochaetaceae bacterium]|nr:hypothetical protein [Spirochaetaceae bacterium]
RVAMLIFFDHNYLHGPETSAHQQRDQHTQEPDTPAPAQSCRTAAVRIARTRGRVVIKRSE